MIELTREQTLRLAWIKLQRTRRERPTTARIKWVCLGCLKEIYVSFNQSTVRAVYCDECKSNKNFNKNNIVELQYVRKLKETQMKMFSGFLQNQFKNVDDESV